MPKRFTLPEAQGLIPEVSRLLREAVALKAEFDKAEEAFRASTERIMAMEDTCGSTCAPGPTDRSQPSTPMARSTGPNSS